jgi:hypothetical protein
MTYLIVLQIEVDVLSLVAVENVAVAPYHIVELAPIQVTGIAVHFNVELHNLKPGRAVDSGAPVHV